MPARVPYLNRDDLPETDRVIFDNLAAERGGTVGNIFRALAHTPNLLRRFCQIGSELRNKTALDPKLRELAICTVGLLTDACITGISHDA
jgi:alkylhydroperoxidase family enzyme